MKLTKSQRRALEILAKESEPLQATYFAMKMWPDTPAWSRYSNVGHGATTGVGITRKGGSYLNYLRKRGWVDMRFESVWLYYITGEGRAALDE